MADPKDLCPLAICAWPNSPAVGGVVAGGGGLTMCKSLSDERAFVCLEFRARPRSVSNLDGLWREPEEFGSGGDAEESSPVAADLSLLVLFAAIDPYLTEAGRSIRRGRTGLSCGMTDRFLVARTGAEDDGGGGGETEREEGMEAARVFNNQCLCHC